MSTSFDTKERRNVHLWNRSFVFLKACNVDEAIAILGDNKYRKNRLRVSTKRLTLLFRNSKENHEMQEKEIFEEE